MTEWLIRELSRLLPHWTFVLLTSELGDAEAASRLHSENTRRLCVERPPQAAGHRAGRGMLRRNGRLAQISETIRHRLAGRHPIARSSNLEAGDRLALLSSLGADLLFCPFGQFQMPAFQDPRVPTVSVIYDLQFLSYPQFFSAHDLAHRTDAYALTCERSDALVCISEATRQSVLKTESVAADRVTTIHIRTGDVKERTSANHTSTDVLMRLGLAPGRFFLYPANLWRHKNHEVLITAVNKVLRRNEQWDFKVVCSGAGLDRLEDLRTMAASLGLADRVLFTGFLPRPELETLLAECRGVIYPSLYEGFGIPLVEAMRAGKPVAC
ncbi:MAG: glycosyltransferase family 4 protein, partial [Chloroflexi bacterium]|nr:glycosyltransferase family 4 protein [Chloroflexota bacterium]